MLSADFRKLANHIFVQNIHCWTWSYLTVLFLCQESFGKVLVRQEMRASKYILCKRPVGKFICERNASSCLWANKRINVKMPFEMACKRKTVQKSLGFPFYLFFSLIPLHFLTVPSLFLFLGNSGKWQKKIFLPKTETELGSKRWKRGFFLSIGKRIQYSTVCDRDTI